MKKPIFEYKDYKKFLCDYIELQPKGGRGLRRKMAEAAGCQIAYISHVLNDRNEFSIEQAESISRFIGFSRDEAEYFVLLVEHARAGTQSLKSFFQKMLDEKKEKFMLLKTRVNISNTLSREDQAMYYSSWIYGGIHMILTIPGYATSDKIAQYLSLPLATVREVLEFLQTRGLIESQKGQYRVKGPFLHLEKDSPLINHHHTIWRMRAIQALAIERQNDIHYASCFTVSEEDAQKLRSVLSETIAQMTEVIKPSKEERLYSFCLDLFEI